MVRTRHSIHLLFMIYTHLHTYFLKTIYILLNTYMHETPRQV